MCLMRRTGWAGLSARCQAPPESHSEVPAIPPRPPGWGGPIPLGARWRRRRPVRICWAIAGVRPSRANKGAAMFRGMHRWCGER